MRLRCPHCGESGVPVLSKLLLAMMLWTHGDGILCRRCGQWLRLARRAVHLQFALYVALSIVFVWSVREPDRLELAWLAGAAMLTVALLAPLEPDPG